MENDKELEVMPLKPGFKIEELKNLVSLGSDYLWNYLQNKFNKKQP